MTSEKAKIHDLLKGALGRSKAVSRRRAATRGSQAPDFLVGPEKGFDSEAENLAAMQEMLASSPVKKPAR